MISVAAAVAMHRGVGPCVRRAATATEQSATAEDKGGDFSVQPEYMTLGKTPLFLRRAESFIVRNHGKTAIRNLKVELAGANDKVFSIDNQCR